MRWLLFPITLIACRSIDPDLDERVKTEVAKVKSLGARVEPMSSLPLPGRWAPGQFAVWEIKEKDFTTLLAMQALDPNTVKLTQLSGKLRVTAELKFAH